MKRTPLQKMTFAAMLTALAFVLITLAAFVPNMDLTMTALAGLCPAVAVMRDGRRAGVMTWAAASVLGLVLGYTRESAVFFVCLFGLYPVVKSFCEGLKSRYFEWTIKIVFANVGLAFTVGVGLLFFPALLDAELPYWLVWLIFNAAFVIYDLFLTRATAVLKARMRV